MTKPLVYCDYNAGAPVRAEAAVAMSRALAAGGNASSVHGVGRRMRALIEDAREKLARAVGASAENVVFTSGATEALHLVLDSFDAAERLVVTPKADPDLVEDGEIDPPAPHIPSLVVCMTEHDAVFEHTKARQMLRVHVKSDGLLDLDGLESMLGVVDKPALVCVHLANNETGVIQPITKIATICRQHGAMLLVDAAQALGRIPLDIADLDATYLVVSSHKLGGPPGAGALILAPGAPFRTTRFGGGQERGRRPGTENGPAIVGFGTAVEWAMRDMAAEIERMRYLRDRFEAGLPRDAVVFGKDAPRLPNVSNFALPGLAAETAVIAMDLEGVAISSGAACSSGKVRASRVLDAMNVPVALAKSALRVSFGYASGANDADIALDALNKVGARRKYAGAA